MTYQIVVLESCDVGGDVLCAAEIWWIAFGKACGWPLTNLTDGGDGSAGHEVSPETREKLSASMRGRPLAPEHGAALGEAARLRWQTEDRESHARRVRAGMADPVVRAQLAEQTRAQFADPAARLAQSARIRAAWANPELREKQKRAHLGHRHTAEHRAKISDALRGERNPAKTPEARAKIREAKLAYWARRRAEETDK